MAVRSRFTRIPKVHDLVMAGIPTETIPTYCALADHAHNKTGLCWPRMDTLARRLSRSPRTIQRHLHLLKEKGLIEFVERKRDGRGRFGAYVYRVLHIVTATARQEVEKVGRRGRERGSKKTAPPDTEGVWPLIRGKLNVKKIPPYPPKRTPRRAIGGAFGFGGAFGEEAPKDLQEEHHQEAAKRREGDSQRRLQGYEWLFE